MNNQQRGFTLLELMVSLAIFAIIGLGSWQVLDRVITIKSVLEKRSAQLHQIQKGLWILSRDLRTVVNRPIRDNNGAPEPSFSSMVPGYSLLLTHQGWQNPLGESRSNLQRVGYSLEPDGTGNKNLVRHYWHVLDRAPNTIASQQILLKGIESIEFQFIDNQGNTAFYWPPETENSAKLAQSAVPAGVRIKLDVPLFGQMERVYSLRDLERSP